MQQNFLGLKLSENVMEGLLGINPGLQVVQDVRHQNMEYAISKGATWPGASLCGGHILCHSYASVGVDILNELDQESWGSKLFQQTRQVQAGTHVSNG